MKNKFNEYSCELKNEEECEEELDEAGLNFEKEESKEYGEFD